jgi:1-deoxy-D-xylulose-5-phosphate synthase
MREAQDPESPSVLLVGYGSMVPVALEVADRIADQGIDVQVVDPRYVSPVPPTVVDLAREARLVVTLEDNGRAGGAGSTLAAALRAADVDTPLRDIGLPREFLQQGPRSKVMADAGLSAQAIARQVTEAVARLAPVFDAQGAGA